jgi:hypothetical protein
MDIPVYPPTLADVFKNIFAGFGKEAAPTKRKVGTSIYLHQPA